MNLKQNFNNGLKSTLMILTLIILLFQHIDSFAQSQSNEKINIGLIYPLSSNWKNAPKDTNAFSLNLIAGVSAVERGLTLAGITNVIHGNANGFQIAGFSNHIGKAANGVTIAGFMNTYESSKNLAIAGFGNFSKKNSDVDISGFINIGGNVSSVQGAGFVNIAKNVNGFQLSGFMNIAKNVKGVQMAGLINIADTANCQIGLINISKNGEMNLGAAIDENQTLLLTFKSGGKFLYGILGLGYNLKNTKEVYAWEVGFGMHVLNLDLFRLNTELTETGLENFKGGEYFNPSIALLPSFRIARNIEIFAGPSFNYVNTNTAEGRALTTKYISSWTGDNGRFQGLYLGYTAGLQVMLK